MQKYRIIVAPNINFKNCEQKIDFVLGFLSAHEKYSEEKKKEYSEYIKTNLKTVLNCVFQLDSTKMLDWFIENNVVTLENFDNVFVRIARKSKPFNCGNVLRRWIMNNITYEA